MAVLIPEFELTGRLEEQSSITRLPVPGYIMLLHEGLTHIHSQIKPRLLFGESFTLSEILNFQFVIKVDF